MRQHPILVSLTSGLKTCTKIYFLFIFKLVQRRIRENSLFWLWKLMTLLWKPSITTGTSSAVSTAERRMQQKAVVYTSANSVGKINKYSSITLSHHIVSLCQKVFICLSQFLTVFGSTLLCIRLKKNTCQIILYFAIYMFTIVKKVLQTLSG